MFYITSLKNQRDAIDHYLKSNVDIVMDFKFEGLKGFDAFDFYLTLNDEFLLEFVCAYLSKLLQMQQSQKFVALATSHHKTFGHSGELQKLLHNVTAWACPCKG